MKVNVEDKGSCRKIIHVEAPADAIAGEYENVLAAFAKAGKVAGFRPGKAPKSVIEKQFSKQILEETKERMLPVMYQNAIKDKDVKTVSIIELSDVEINKKTGMVFSVTVDVAPEFKIPKYKKISLKKNKVEVTGDDVESSMKRLLDNFSKFEDVEGRAVKQDDLIMVDYSSDCEGKSLEEIAPEHQGIGKGEDFWLIVGDSEIELFPGFSERIEGCEIGEERDIDVHFPDDYRLTDLAGKDAVYKMKVKGIREKILPEIDEELLKKFQVESESELKERIEKDLLAEREHVENERLKEEITKYLLGKVSFDLPQSIVDHEASVIENTMRDRMGMQGMNAAQIEQDTSITDMARKTSEDRVKASYIMSKIADAEEIEVEEDELKQRVEAMAMRYGMQGPQLRSELEKRGSIDNIKSDIRMSKTLNFLLENAKIKK